MKLIFAGTPAFATTALLSLLDKKYEIALVLTQPDRPAGRSMQSKESAVKKIAQLYHLTLAQPDNLKDDPIQSLIASVNADLMIVAAYGLLLPKAVLALPKMGCLNIHASLLPRWRGAAPIQRAIEAGDDKTGITIMQMDAGLDTGDILSQQSISILPKDNAESLSGKLATLGANLLIKTIDCLPEIMPIKQSDNGVCYAEKIQKSEGHIHWQESANLIVQKINAFNPAPGTFTFFRNHLIKLWGAEIVRNQHDKPGKIIQLNKEGITVSAGSDAVNLTVLQPANSKKLSAQELISGYKLELGQLFDA